MELFGKKSMLDVVKENLRKIDQKFFVSRIIYIGEYNQSTEDFQMIMEYTINHIRVEYKYDKPYGLLLVYPNYFIHVLETTEDFIYRHFQDILNKSRSRLNLGKVIIICCQHHLYKTYFHDWHTIYKELITAQKIEDSSWDNIKKVTISFLKKLYSLCEYILKIDKNSPFLNVLLNNDDQVLKYIPEWNLVDFLIKTETPLLRDVREHMKQYNSIPTVRFYNERIWPAPSEFIQYDLLFDMKI